MRRRFAWLAISLLATSTLWAADGQKVLLQTEIPEEVLAGTPPDVLLILFPHLAKPPEEPPQLMVPEGSQLLSRGKKVTSSDSNPVLGKLSFVTDGKKEGAEDNYVELGPLKQWVQIDLEKTAQIDAVYVWHYFREARSYHDVVVQVSDDPEFKAGVHTVFNNDQDNSLGLGIGKDRPYIETHFGQLIDARGVSGRYVRLYSAGSTANDLNHYVEVEVFGRPAS